eukprot:augustus_masked-scaffold_7-processed-gene-12.56-mRNA-1 protein AED:0.34 eAED:0.36 QI:0/0/0/0.33/1/1/3/0/379
MPPVKGKNKKEKLFTTGRVKEAPIKLLLILGDQLFPVKYVKKINPDLEKPLGGKFSFDKENRKKLPDSVVVPHIQKIDKDEVVRSVIKLVEAKFPDHPGKVSSFNYPTTREEYLDTLETFVLQKLKYFGPYQDAISTRGSFLFHSILSPGLNLGLITPADVVQRVSPLAREHPELISSIEGFIRQVIGWREFVKGIHDNFSHEMCSMNFWNHKRKLRQCWYTGNTGLPFVDDVIRKSLKYGYAHHIERLMIMANMFNLVEAEPVLVYNWFMEMYVDSAQWVMEANVYGMGLMSEGGIFSTKPYICSSNYILKMSSYKKGPWCDVVDGLYWRFIAKNRAFFEKNHRMAMMVRLLDKQSPEKQRRIQAAAENFLERSTYLE